MGVNNDYYFIAKSTRYATTCLLEEINREPGGAALKAF
jgi:hypothetical protein